MGRLAVALAYRKTGAGRKMVEALEEAVRRGELSGMARVEGEEEVRIKAHVQRGLLGFYEKCGYRQEGGEIDEVSPAFQKSEVMRRRRLGSVAEKERRADS